MYAQLALLYRLDEDVVPPIATNTSFEECGRPVTKALGDCFEARIGALAAEGRQRELDEWLLAMFVVLVDEIDPMVRESLREEDAKLEAVRGMWCQPARFLVCVREGRQ